MLALFDVGLFTLSKNHITHNFPGKLLGYMQAGLPILGSINPENDLEEIIINAKAGFISINGEDKKLYENAIKLLNKNNRRETANNAKNLLKSTFSVKTASVQILQMIK